MAHTTDQELIAMYQDRVEKVALEKLRWEKEKAELERQIEHFKALKHLEINEQEDHLRQLANLEQEHQNYQEDTQKQLDKKDRIIEALYREVIALRRRVWGKSSERYIPEDSRQRKIEFEG